MKRIVIPADVMQKIIDCDQGARTNQRVHVDWPELRLTEQQRDANAAAVAVRRPPPYHDTSYIELVFER